MRVIGPGGELDIGTLETSPSVGIIDYSRRVTDDFGVTTVVERGFARRMSVRISLPTDNVDAVQQGLADLRAVPAQWIADEGFAWLNFDGFFKDFAIDLAIPPVSFCSLTVEGLAETEVVTETGIDPAPEPSSSTLLLLQPVTITDGMLVSSNVAETDYPEWAALTTYPAGARVILAATHRIYESAAAGNLNNSPTGSSGLWFDVGPTNRWAMFDQALGTKTSRADSIVLTLSAGNVDAIGMLDVIGTSVRVQTTGYDQTKAVGPGALTFLDLPGLADNVTVTISGTGTVSVGTLVAGALVQLGVTEGSPTADITDFSRKEIDDFGDVTVIPRAWAKRMSTAALIRTDALDVVANRIASVRAKPSLWIADDGTDSLTLYGFFKDFSIEVGDYVSKLSLTVEGLSEATPFGDSFEGLSIIEKTAYKRSATTPAEPSGGSYDFSTQTTSPPAGWSATLPAGTDPAWVSTATAFKAGMGGTASFGDWSTPVIAFANGVAGTDGLDGDDGKFIEFVWKRAATVPATPTGNGIPASWSDEPPSGSDPLWMSKAKQELNGVLVAGEAWSVPIRHDGPPGTDGEDGTAGVDGLNNATVFAFKRSATTPAVPSATATYTFATGSLTGLDNGWTSSVPTSDGNPLWVITATASSTGTSDTIATGEWSSPVIQAQDGSGGSGSPGAPAVSGYLTAEVVQLFAYANGNVVSYAKATGDFKIFAGNTDVSTSFTLSTQSNPQSLTIGYVNRTYSVTAGFANGDDEATVTIRATGSGTYAGVIIDKIFRLTKAKGGFEIVTSLPATNLFEGRVVYLTTDDKLYRYTGSAWTAAVPAVDISGEITSTQIADDAITSPKIAANAVTASEIAANAVTAGKIAADAVTANAIEAGAVTAAKINVTSLSAITAVIGLLRTATTGARMELEDNQMRAYDAAGTLRAQFGVWT